MPAFFDLEHYMSLKAVPGTGPSRLLAMSFLMSIRDHATRWMLGPDPKPNSRDIDCCYFIAGTKYGLVPLPVAVVPIIARFLQQLVGGNGPLTLQLHRQQLVVQVTIEPRDLAPQITVELPIVKSLERPAAELLTRYANSDGLIEFGEDNFADEPNTRGPRYVFQLPAKRNRRDCDGAPFLGRRRMPFHPDMHAPTKFLVMSLMLCSRDRATEVRFSPTVDELWTRYFVDGKWHDFVPPPAFVWPQLVRVIERHAVLIRPESNELDVPAVGWLELRWGQDYSPDSLAVFLDPRKDSPMLRIAFMSVLPPDKVDAKPTEKAPTDGEDDDDTDDGMLVEFSPDDQ